MKRRLSLVMCCLSACVAAAKSELEIGSGYNPGVQELRRRFLRESGYDASSRPANDSAEPTVVRVVIPLSEVNYVALVDEWFTVALYFCKFWKEPRFSWDPKDYGGSHRFSGTTKEIWWPRVEVVNAKRQDIDLLQQSVSVYSDGNTWSCDALKVKTPCSVDLSDFPNDRQTCSVRAGSSAYSDSEVKMTGYAAWGEPHMNASTEWVLEHISFENHTETNRSFADVVFHLRRSARRHRYTFTVPGISSALVVLASFWMPPNSDRRLTLACLNLFFLATIFNRVSRLTAASVSVPKMLLFLGLLTLVELFTAAGSILIIRSSHSNSRIRVPDTLHRFVSGSFAKFLCLNRSEPTTITAKSCEHQEDATFDESLERKRRWLILAQAVDRVCFVIFGFAALGFLL
ncbi:acetylcholine receptor subunit beta-like isoform X2 [Dermacentor albipictus]|uniref:acetylcholine receptor subunit beta-like isoform X2 n=1 Tax=Dermacentor albipictus TaxID=60249 RepID=UPI0031FD6FEA